MISQKLYDLAFRFREARLWERMNEDQVFAVSLPGERVGYCVIAGNAGKLHALILYTGESGWNAYLRVIDGFDETDPRARFEWTISNECIQLDFVDGDELSPRERIDLMGYVRRNGLTEPGTGDWPRFQKYIPATVPWQIRTADDKADITEALSAALALAADPRPVPMLEDRFDGVPVPLLTRRRGGFDRTETLLPKRVPPTYASPRMGAGARVKKLKALPKKGTLDVGLMHIKAPYRETPSSAPTFPDLFIAYETEREIVWSHGVAENGDKAADEIVAAFADDLIDEGMAPATVRVSTERTRCLIAGLCRAAGIRLLVVPHEELADLYDVVAQLEDDQRGGSISDPDDDGYDDEEDDIDDDGDDFEDDDDDLEYDDDDVPTEEDAEEALETVNMMLTHLPLDVLRQMPASTLRQLSVLIGQGILTPEAERKLKKLLK